MPIHMDKLAENEKAHVGVKHDATWAMAAAALQQKSGNLSWPLVVRKSDGTYAAASYAKILEAGDASPDTLAENLPGLVKVDSVDIKDVGTETAQGMAQSAPAKLIVVTNEGKYAGIVGTGSYRTGSDLPASKLDNLAGGNVDLSKLGDFLLGDS